MQAIILAAGMGRRLRIYTEYYKKLFMLRIGLMGKRG